MNEALPEWFAQTMIECGWPESDVRAWKTETRLFHDLRILGDDFFDLVRGIERNYKLDWEGFDYDTHFPAELSEDSVPPVIFKRKRAQEMEEKYKPFTFGMMIERIVK